MKNSYQNSTTAQIIDAIINQLSFEGESQSDIADILLSILNQTPYEKEPSSVIAELFIKLKAKIEGESFEPFDKPYISNIAEIIKSILDETEYNNAPNSRIAELLLELKEELEAYVERTASGAVANFTTSLALPLVNCEVAEGATKVTRCGKNILNLNDVDLIQSEENSQRYGIEILKSGVYRISGSFDGEAYLYARVVNGETFGNIFYIQVGEKSTAKDKTINVNDGEKLILYNASSLATQTKEITQMKMSGIQIEIGSSTTTFESYQGNDFDISEIENINTFIGVNNIFTDNGDVSVTYKAKETD